MYVRLCGALLNSLLYGVSSPHNCESHNVSISAKRPSSVHKASTCSSLPHIAPVQAEADRAAAAPPLEVESDEEETKSPRETRRLSAKERLAAAKAKAQAAAASKRKELEASM